MNLLSLTKITAAFFLAMILFGCGDSGNSVNEKVYGSCIVDDVCTSNVAFEDCDGAFESDALCPAELPLFEQKILEHENELREMIERIGGLFATDNPYVQNMLYLFSNGRLPDGSRRNNLILCLWSLGIGRPEWEGFSGFIREPLIVELLVYALADDERDVRGDGSFGAFTYLTKHTEWNLLAPFKSDIRQAIAKHGGTIDSLRLFALLDPTESEKQEWLALSPRTLAVRAALGDVQSEDSLINLFETETNPATFEQLALDLAYVGFSSQKSRVALVKGLDMDLYRTYVHMSVTVIDGPSLTIYGVSSGIIDVVTALRRLHPGEPIFYGDFDAVNDVMNMMQVNDPRVIDYLTNLAAWAEQTYDVNLNLPKEYSFIRIYEDDFPDALRPENIDTDDDMFPILF